ncbi:MAG: carbohydrate kinase family protein [Chloroflexota bacterium]
MTIARPLDVLTVGGAAMDLIMTVPELPGHDEKVLGELVGWQPGGPATNFGCAASRLGLNIAALALIGDDENGRRITADLEAHNIDTTYLQVKPGQASLFTVILIDPTGEKVIVVVPTIEEIYPLDVAEKALSQTKFLYMMPKPEPQFLALARLAHQQGAEVMIDIEPTICADRDHLKRILAETDIASFNRFGFTAAAGVQPSIEAARDLLQFGPHTIMVTQGSAGSLAVTKDEAVEQPGSVVEVVDTTGAGDTFHAAYVTALLQGDSLTERLRFANATAALSVTAMGPRGWLPTHSEVRNFIQQSSI